MKYFIKYIFGNFRTSIVKKIIYRYLFDDHYAKRILIINQLQAEVFQLVYEKNDISKKKLFFFFLVLHCFILQIHTHLSNIMLLTGVPYIFRILWTALGGQVTLRLCQWLWWQQRGHRLSCSATKHLAPFC